MIHIPKVDLNEFDCGLRLEQHNGWGTPPKPHDYVQVTAINITHSSLALLSVIVSDTEPQQGL